MPMQDLLLVYQLPREAVEEDDRRLLLIHPSPSQGIVSAADAEAALAVAHPYQRTARDQASSVALARIPAVCLEFEYPYRHLVVQAEVGVDVVEYPSELGAEAVEGVP